jgi:magnesium-transporting ATPase (P-type)
VRGSSFEMGIELNSIPNFLDIIILHLLLCINLTDAPEKSNKKNQQKNPTKKSNKKFSRNELEKEKRDSWLKLYFEQFQSPVVYMLLMASIACFVIEDTVEVRGGM